MRTTYLDWALKDFSGYIAADELYDGPFCVLSIVDNRTFKRLAFRVLNHTPSHKDIISFFRSFQADLKKRGLKVKAITTDASPLYPEPIKKVFGDVPHQLCIFHIIKELTKVILRAVAQARKALKDQMPTLGRGRPASKQAKRTAQVRKRLQKKIGDLFENRYLFVRHDLTPKERETLQWITRGQPQLRTLRRVMEEVYRLFDRRCRTETALAKLAKLRSRVSHMEVRETLNKLYSGNLEKALTFLNDRLLPATSNAVERGNRRHRKMQKTVYRVRKRKNIEGRIALDMFRDAQAQGRQDTILSLHRARTPKAWKTKNAR
jgi:hypothetical protein